MLEVVFEGAWREGGCGSRHIHVSCSEKRRFVVTSSHSNTLKAALSTTDNDTMAPPTSTAPSLAFDASTVVVITGCSRGIGFKLAKAILETTQSKVVATARNLDKAVLLGELAAKFEGRVLLVELDTENRESVQVSSRT